MSRQLYSPGQLQFLREQWPRLGLGDLTASFNQRFGTDKTRQQIRSTLKNHKIVSGRQRGEMNKGRIRVMTKDQDAFVRANYAAIKARDLVVVLRDKFDSDITLGQLKSYVKNHGIKSGRNGHYPKGNVPLNAGTKVVMKGSCTSFQPGNRPVNAVPVGTISRSTKDGYLKRKVAEPNKWVWVHLDTWKRHNGPVPKGHVVCFKDGNQENCSIDNLELVPRAELAIMNKFCPKNAPVEARSVIRNMAKTKLAIGVAKRRLKEKQTA